ncbi:ATP-binding protein [Saccharopolyspora hattusasensis]|uniref:ATP-binding protein n=1 Tax=Saccharopolyspora hattusasensis TaxID=1128679 RepID=UPI003D95CF60
MGLEMMSNGGVTPGAAGDGECPVPALRYQRVRASPGELPALRDELAGWGRCAGLGSDAVQALALACYEAMANVVEHAYAHAGEMDVEAVHFAAERRVQVTVTDRGSWVPLGLGAGVEGGRGLPLIRRLADEAVITPSDTGSVVTMSWSTAGESS